MDLAVKHRFFRHLSGGDDPDSERIYRLHIELRSGARMKAGLATDKWKRKLDDYVSSAHQLHEWMMADGFRREFPVPIDPDGELLDGSHRVACALALGMPHVWCELRPDYVWAPRWDYLWFVQSKMPREDIRRVLRDWIDLNYGSDRS